MGEIYTSTGNNKKYYISKKEIRNMKRNMKKVPLIKKLSEDYHKKELEEIEILEKNMFK